MSIRNLNSYLISTISLKLSFNPHTDLSRFPKCPQFPQMSRALISPHKDRWTSAHTCTQYDSGQPNVFAACLSLIWMLQTWDNMDPVMTVCLTSGKWPLGLRSFTCSTETHIHTQESQLTQKQMYKNNPQPPPWHRPSNPKQLQEAVWGWSFAYGGTGNVQMLSIHSTHWAVFCDYSGYYILSPIRKTSHASAG